MHYEEMGRCPLINCIYAHGAEDLANREINHECAPPTHPPTHPPTEIRIECLHVRRLAEKALRASKLEAQEMERATMAALAAPDCLSLPVLQVMRTAKLASCARALQQMGCAADAAESAARAAGGDVALASSMLFDGAPKLTPTTVLQ